MSTVHIACALLGAGAALLGVSVVLGLRDGERQVCTFPNITDDTAPAPIPTRTTDPTEGD